MEFYKVSDVQSKVNKYLGDNAFTVSPRFAKVENLREPIEKAIRKGCSNNKLRYQIQFNQVIETLESAILSSRNWFNDSGLNFKSVRDCLSIKVEKTDDFLKNFELRKNVSGNKKEKHYDIKDIVCIAQAKRFKGSSNFYDNSNWLFNPCLRFKNVLMIDNSDAYQEEIIDYKASAKGAIPKSFNKGYLESTILIGLHYHSYSEEGKPNDKDYDYSPTIEKFELILLV